MLCYDETVGPVLSRHSNGSYTIFIALTRLGIISTSTTRPTTEFLSTLAAIPEVPSVSEQSLLPPVADAPKEMEIPKEINISIMPDPEPPADLYLSKGKTFSSPRKRFQVSLDVHFTQYRAMTK